MTSPSHLTMRVNAPRALGLDPAAIDELAEVEGAIPRASTSLSHAEERTLLKTVKASGSVIEQGAQAAAAAAYRQPLEFADVVNRGGTDFLDLELRRKYRGWKHRNLNGWKDDLEAWAAVDADAPGPPDFHPDDAATYAAELEQWAKELHEWSLTVQGGPTTPVPRRTPLDYATGKRGGRPHAKLTLLLGAGYRARLRGPAGSRMARLQAAARWPRLVASVWPAAGADAVTQLGDVLRNRDRLRAVVVAVAAKTRVAPELLDVEKTTDLIQRLAANHAGGDINALTDEGVAALMGKPLTPEAFVHRAMLGLDMMHDEVQWSPALFELMLDLPGIELFLPSVIKKAGYEHGYTFEIFLVARELFLREDPRKLWMQIVVGGKAGPDLGRLIDEDGVTRVRLIQAKSYEDLGTLLRASKSGEIWSQLSSDLRRLTKDGFRVADPTDPTNWLEISRTIEFKIDWFHLRKTSFEIPNVKPEDLHALGQSSNAVKEAFYNANVRDEVAALQKLLDSPEFRFEIGLDQELGVHSGVPGFKLEVEIVDQIFPGESAAEVLEEMFVE
jgi:hypothetical protein